MNAKFLRSCGLAALLALSAVAEPLPAGQPAKTPVAPAIQAVKQPDRITTSDDAPFKKPAAKPAPVPTKVTEAPTAKPVTATPAASKINEAPATKPAASAPAPAKVTEKPTAKPLTATPAASKINEAPAAKPAAAAPAPAKVTEAPTAKPVTATPAASKINEALPTRPAASAPAPAKVTEAPTAKPVTAPSAASKIETPAAKAAAKPAQPPVLTDNLVFPQAKTELKRLMIGNQAGIVKVLGPNREGVSYSRGIDDKNIARFSDDACGSIFCALGISHDKLSKVAREIMINYSTLPRKEAVAFLGAVVASAHLDADTDIKAETFLVQVMETDKDVHARRQAVLALAVKHTVEPSTTDRVLALFEHSENLWETFPVQQYFEYHASQVKRLGHFSQVRERIAAVKSLYTPAILQALDDTKPVTVVP